MKTFEEKSQSEEWGGWKIVSDMLDKPDSIGIYLTSECYEKLHDFVVEQKEKARQETLFLVRGEVIMQIIDACGECTSRHQDTDDINVAVNTAVNTVRASLLTRVDNLASLDSKFVGKEAPKWEFKRHVQQNKITHTIEDKNSIYIIHLK